LPGHGKRLALKATLTEAKLECWNLLTSSS